jgi:hypothetical protein
MRINADRTASAACWSVVPMYTFVELIDRWR